MTNKTKLLNHTALLGYDSPMSAGNAAALRTATALHDRLMLSIPEVCVLLGIGRTSVYGLIAGGTLKPVKLGTRTLIPSADVTRFANELVLRRDAERE